MYQMEVDNRTLKINTYLPPYHRTGKGTATVNNKYANQNRIQDEQKLTIIMRPKSGLHHYSCIFAHMANN